MRVSYLFVTNTEKQQQIDQKRSSRNYKVGIGNWTNMLFTQETWQAFY